MQVDTISSLTNLSESYDLAGRVAEARQTIDKAVRTGRESGEKTGVAQALKIRARIQIRGGHYEAGLADLEGARALFQETGEHLDEADILADMARARLRRRDYTGAVNDAVLARDLAQQ